MSIHDKIRKLREIHNWTQEEMAERSALSKNGYANIERGDSVPNLENLEKIANVFGMKVEELITWDDKNFLVSIVNGNTRDNYTSYYHVSTQNFSHEMEKCQQTIQHQQELLNQKDIVINSLTSENKILKEILAVLKDKEKN